MTPQIDVDDEVFDLLKEMLSPSSTLRTSYCGGCLVSTLRMNFRHRTERYNPVSRRNPRRSQGSPSGGFAEDPAATPVPPAGRSFPRRSTNCPF